MAFAIYAKRCGLKVNNIPVYDKQFRALDYGGVRVFKLTDAGTYATREDAQEVLDTKCREYAEAGLAQYEIRSVK